jgi:hypothetical protein
VRARGAEDESPIAVPTPHEQPHCEIGGNDGVPSPAARRSCETPRLASWFSFHVRAVQRAQTRPPIRETSHTPAPAILYMHILGGVGTPLIRGRDVGLKNHREEGRAPARARARVVTEMISPELVRGPGVVPPDSLKGRGTPRPPCAAHGCALARPRPRSSICAPGVGTPLIRSRGVGLKAASKGDLATRAACASG